MSRTWVRKTRKKEQIILLLFYLQKEKCTICGNLLDLKTKKLQKRTIDHLIPVSEGGNKRMISNLCLTHYICNVAKKSRLPTKEELERHLPVLVDLEKLNYSICPNIISLYETTLGVRI